MLESLSNKVASLSVNIKKFLRTLILKGICKRLIMDFTNHNLNRKSVSHNLRSSYLLIKIYTTSVQ